MIFTKTEHNGSDVHPGLKKVKPADAGIPLGRQAQHQNEDASADDD
jgi:hypothetical protein